MITLYNSIRNIAQKRATAKYEKENYDKILVRFPKGTKERILETGGPVSMVL